MTIHTSRITTQADGDLQIDPNGTGEVKLTKLAGQGEVPLSVNNEGEVGPVDNREMAALESVSGGDLISVQRGATHFRVDADEFIGGGIADPTLANVSWIPSTPPGSGTLEDPFVLTPAVVATPGGDASSTEQMVLNGLRAGAQVLITEQGGTSGLRFEQGSKFTDEEGAVPPFAFVYNDTPASQVGEVYNGLIRVGSSIYISWEVTQVANNTVFGPKGQPTASPATVNYLADEKYGTVTGVWADGSRTLESDGNVAFSVQGGTLDTSNKFVQDGQEVAVAFVDSVVAAAAEGDIISGQLNATDNTFYLPISMVKDTTPTPYSFNSISNAAPSTEATTGLQIVPGFNAPTTLNATGGTNALTSIEVSINGAARVAASGVSVNPGDTIQLFGTTGAGDLTTYSANVSLGGVVATWSVTTAENTVDPTIGQPSIISPLNGSSDLTPDVVVTSSTYVPLNGAGAHSASTWEVYESEAAPVVSSYITDSDDGRATPLLLDSAAPTGLLGEVVMIDSPTPTVIGGVTQPSSYTIKTNTISAINTPQIWSGAITGTASGDAFSTSAQYGGGNPGWQNAFNGIVSDPYNAAVAGGGSDTGDSRFDIDYGGTLFPTIQSADDTVRIALDARLDTDRVFLYMSNGDTLSFRGSDSSKMSFVGSSVSGSMYDVNLSAYVGQYITGFRVVNTSGYYAGVVGFKIGGEWMTLGQPITGNTQLSFTSPNPDLQYFQVGDIVQGGTNYATLWTPVSSGNTSVEEFFSTVLPLDNTKYLYFYSAITWGPGLDLPGGGVISFRYSGQDLDNPGKDVYVAVDGVRVKDVPAAAFPSEFNFTIPAGGANIIEIRGIDSGAVLAVYGNWYLNNTAIVSSSAVSVLSTNVALNQMVVDGGNWSTNPTLVGNWTSMLTAGSGSYLKSPELAFDGKLTTTGEANLAPLIFTPSPAITYTTSIEVYGNTQYFFSVNSNPEIYYPNANVWMTIATGPGVLSSLVCTRPSNFDSGWAALRIDGKILIDSQFGGSAGANNIEVPTTASGTIASTNGAQATLTGVTGRWIGSGAQNFAGTNFYVATKSPTGNPGAPQTEPPGAGYTQITPSATTLTTATLDDSNLEDGKFYFSRVKYSDGSIESPFSAYNQFSASTSVIPTATPGSIWRFTDNDASFTQISAPVDMVNFTTGYNWIAAVGVDGRVYTGGDAASTVNLTLDNRFPSSVVAAAATYGGDYNGPSIVFLQESGQVISYLDANNVGVSPPEPCVAIGSFAPVSQYIWAKGESGKIYGWANARIGVAGIGSVSLVADSWTDLQIVLPGGREVKEIVDPGSGGYAAYNLAILATDGTLWAVNTVGEQTGTVPGFLPASTNTNSTPTQFSAPGITFTGISAASAAYGSFGSLSAVDTTGRLWYGATAIANNYGTGFEQVFDEVAGLEGQNWLEPLQGGYFTYGPVAGVKDDGFVYVSDTSGGLVFRKPTGQTVATSSLGSSRFCQQYAATVSLFFIFN